MIDDALATSWNRIRSELRQAVTESTWHGWLESLSLRELVGDVLLVCAPDDTRAWVVDRYGRLLQACAAAVLGPDIRVELVAPGVHTPPATAQVPDVMNPKLTFDQFVIGDSNRLAHAAALAVAELPGLAYNPLFICGRPGLGKTHLLHSIANYVQAYGDGLAVRYTTAEAFTSEYVGASRTGAMPAFKTRFRDVGVLLVDDVQFLQEKAKTEEEFFHTFNAIHAAGAQIVLTSDRPPRDLEGLEDRLRARFEAGLVTELAAPDASTRATILRKRVIQDGLEEIEDAALELIAARVDDSVRALEGALIRVVAFASLTGRPATHELAAEVLGGLYPDLRPHRRTVTEIQEATCNAFGVSVEDLRSSTRAASVAWARQVAMYLSRELTDATLPAIGRAFGRNHTTVMHAVKKTQARMSDDPQAYDAIKRLAQELGE
ncbi:MAG: chromosomal replication initiator protein [Solirubrobacteraceae bacterium]|nr:chromosomal replication initiator protein [Solirubrobacteraceae bacterium]